MKDRSRLEVLVPFHGDPGHLAEAVASLVAQDDPSWRATIVDDAWPDPEAATRVAALDERVRVVRHDVNRGVSATFSHALSLATSPWLTIMGGDDRLLPTYVSTLREIVATTVCDVVQPGVQVVDHEGRVVRPLADRVKAALRPGEGLVRGEPAVSSLVRGNWTYFPSLCWRREAIAGLGFSDHDVVLDLDLLVRVLLAGGALAVDDRVVFAYRRHDASVSSLAARTTHRFEEERTFHAELAEVLDARGWRRAARTARRRPTSRSHAALLLPALARSGDRRAAGGALRHVVAR